MGGQGHSCKTDFDWLQARTNMQKKEEQHEDARVRVPLSIAKKVDKLFSRVGANRKKVLDLEWNTIKKKGLLKPSTGVTRSYHVFSLSFASSKPHLLIVRGFGSVFSFQGCLDGSELRHHLYALLSTSFQCRQVLPASV